MRIVTAPFEGRANFSAMLALRNVWHAVEVGTDRGHFARQLLEGSWRGQLWCIDPYEPYAGMNWDREADLAMAVTILAPFVPRVRIVRATSEQWLDAADEWKPHIGFVYIDGDHEEESVFKDIVTWWPIVKPGGVLAGHDFGEPHPGVERALVRYFLGGVDGLSDDDIVVHVVRDVDANSWYVEKPAEKAEPEEVDFEEERSNDEFDEPNQQ